MRVLWRVTPILTLLGGCATQTAAGEDNMSAGDDSSKADDADGDGAAMTVCRNAAVFPNAAMAKLLADDPGALGADGAAAITNYTAWPVYDPDAASAIMDSTVTRTITDPEEAVENLAARFGECSDAVAAHLRTAKPNIYIYFSGFGGDDQNNSLVGQGAILRWINRRDPNALIFSVNWNCPAEENEFCRDNTEQLSSKPSSPHVESMVRAIDGIVPQIAGADTAANLKQVVMALGDQQRGYDSAHSHSMWLAARLIDQLLVADQGPDGQSRIGDIHIAGYSMGAHTAAQLLVQDFDLTGATTGFGWSTPACEDGGGRCTVAGLSKLKWSLAMGLSGWSDAIVSHNAQGRSSGEVEQFENGGLFRVAADRYRGKLAVLNRRMDPTGNSDDTYQRGFLDIFFGDYNHYSHDYDLPVFVEPSLVRALDAFLETDRSEDVPEFGILADNAGMLTFDDCASGGMCEAKTGYLAHKANRSHSVTDIPLVTVATVDGVEHPDSANNVAASFVAELSDPISLHTFDQEDLRGGVELYLRPHFDVGAPGLHGLFSYGSCEGSQDDLMPQAFIRDGQLVFEMQYEGETFQVQLDAAAAGLVQDAWTHLAFTWELPVESLTAPHETADELAAAVPGMMPDLQQHGVALALATGLTKPLATTYKRQAGEGFMTIFVNGELQAMGSLGSAASARECLPAAEVLSAQDYDVNGATYPEYSPYARYARNSGDTVTLSSVGPLGTKCKAYRVRNESVFFGCAQSSGVNADADMDDITLIWGPGRTDYVNIDHSTGAPKLWPVGAEYGPEFFQQ